MIENLQINSIGLIFSGSSRINVKTSPLSENDLGPKVIEQISIERRSGRHSYESRNPDASKNLDSGSSPE